ncbi:MAG: DedA family protein [Pseudonocardia sp.]
MLELLESLPPAAVLALAFLLPALEASTLLGVVVPGEVAILVAGAAAHAGGVPLWAVIGAAVSGAVAGDTAGFALGRRYGDALVGRLPRRLVRPDAVARTRALIRRRGGAAVFLGRFTALFRALVPGLAGASGVPWRVFLPCNVAGAALWATGVAVLGYLAGAGLRTAERRLGLASEIVLAAVVVIGVVVVALRHRSGRRSGRRSGHPGSGPSAG